VAHALIYITGVDEQEKGLVRVISGTAFACEGEIEEALESLGAGTGVENLDAYVPSKSTPLHAALNRLCLCGSVALIVQIYLSINRVDLAKKEFDRARKWAEDDLLLQQIEASIGPSHRQGLILKSTLLLRGAVAQSVAVLGAYDGVARCHTSTSGRNP
jgi:hypothetical protein